MFRKKRNGAQASSNKRRQQLHTLILLWLISSQVALEVHSFTSPSCRPLASTIRRKPTIPTGLTPLMAFGKTGGRIVKSEEDFSESIVSTMSRPILCFFTAPWCGPCRLSVPIVRDVMKKFTGKIDVLEVCTDDLPTIAVETGVVSIPTIQMYYNGKLYDTIVGCVATNVLSRAVEKVLEETVYQENTTSRDT